MRIRKQKILAIPSVDLNADESMTTDEALARVSMLLAKTENPKVLSEVSENEIRLSASLFAVGEKMEDNMILSFLNNLLLLRVSKMRKGRGELLEIARSVRDMPESRLNKLKTLFSGIGK